MYPNESLNSIEKLNQTSLQSSTYCHALCNVQCTHVCLFQETRSKLFNEIIKKKQKQKTLCKTNRKNFLTFISASNQNSIKLISLQWKHEYVCVENAMFGSAPAHDKQTWKTYMFFFHKS